MGCDDSLIVEGWIREKPCRVTINTRATVTIVRPDIVAVQPERKPSRPYILQMTFGETIPVLKEARIEVSLGRGPLKIWEFATEIWDEFILG
jgi:hypothetical protein